MGPLPATDRLEAKQLRMCLLSKRALILRQKSKVKRPLWDVVRGEGRKGPSCGCHPMGHWVWGEATQQTGQSPPHGAKLPPPPPPVRSLKVPSGARSAVASSPVGTGLANSGRRVERLPLKVGMTLLQSLKCVVRAAPPIWSPLLSGTPDQEAKPTATSSQR